MAKVSSYPSATTPLTGTEQVYTVQGANNRKTTTQSIANLAVAGAGAVAKSGDTMTGALVIAPTSSAGVVSGENVAASNAMGMTLRGRVGGTNRVRLDMGDFAGILPIAIFVDEVNARNMLALAGAVSGAAGTGSITVTDQLKIGRGASGQTNPLLNMTDEAGTTLTRVSAAGACEGIAGSATAPSFSAFTDANTGMYFSAADTLNLTTGGTSRLALTNVGAAFTTPVFASGSTGGTAAAPGFSFSADTNTGMFRVTGDTLGFATNGLEAFRVTAYQHMSMGGPPTVATQQSFITIGNGTGSLGAHQGGTEASRTAITINMDTDPAGLQPQDLIHVNLNIVPGTPDESTSGIMVVTDVNDTGGGAAGVQVIGVSGVVKVFSASGRPTWGGNFIAEHLGGDYRAAIVGCEVQARNNNAAFPINHGIGLSITNAGDYDVQSAIMSVANFSHDGGYRVFLTTTTADKMKPKDFWAWHGPIGNVSGVTNRPNGVPAFAVTCDDVTGSAIRLGTHTATPAFISTGGVSPGNMIAGQECAMYFANDKIVFVYNKSGTIRYKSLDLSGTGVTWVMGTTPP